MEENNNLLEEPEVISSPAPQTGEEFPNITEQAVLVQNLVNSGVLQPQQGQYYMSQLARQSFDRLKQDTEQAATVNVFDDFEKENPDFFKSEGRSQVLDYLKNSNTLFDKDEINIISKMVEKLENSAIERYIKQQAHEKALNYENETAKRKLTANAQNGVSFSDKNRAFTREQIGRMSGAEFAKYEPLIMSQLKQGLIR